MTSPPPHWHWRPVDKWTKCLQEFSALDPGLVLGPLSQMTINYHQQVSGLKWGPNIHHRTSVPVFPGSWEEAAKTWSGSHHQDASWRAGQITDDDDQAMIVSVVLPQTDWCLRHSIRQQQNIGLESGVGLPPSIDVKQHQTKHVSHSSHA